MFARWLSRREDPMEEVARALYTTVVEQARRVEFYRDWGVPDSVDGRFEMLVLHVFLVLRRLKQAPEQAGDLGQRLFDVLFRDLDASLREMGVGDLSVGKKIKGMAEAFYGRVSSYETGLEAGGAALDAAVERNLFGTVQATPEQVGALAGYFVRAAEGLDAQPVDALLSGRPAFAAPPEPPQPASAVDPASGPA